MPTRCRRALTVRRLPLPGPHWHNPIADFASGGELFFWLKRDRVFSQSRARLYAAELILALEHLHSLDIVYRDLKVGGRVCLLACALSPVARARRDTFGSGRRAGRGSLSQPTLKFVGTVRPC
jgi:serine/threonine protein kinase